jgi:hypothetical protein
MSLSAALGASEPLCQQPLQFEAAERCEVKSNLVRAPYQSLS